MGFTRICGYVERGSLVVEYSRVLSLSRSPKESQAAPSPKANPKELDRVRDHLLFPTSNLSPLTNVHPQHFLPITCFSLILLSLLHLIDRVQILLELGACTLHPL